MKNDKETKVDFVEPFNCKGTRQRIRLLNWIEYSPESIELKQESDSELENKVREALNKLTFAEREFIKHFYFECRSYSEISTYTGKKIYRLETIHKNAFEKLRKMLGGYVEKRFKLPQDGVSVEKSGNSKPCLICQNPNKTDLEEIISSKKENQTWKNVMQEFKKRFGLVIKTPQILITHKNKHML